MDLIHRNVANLALTSSASSDRGHVGKKVTAITFFRCPTVTHTATHGNLDVLSMSPVETLSSSELTSCSQVVIRIETV